MSPRKLTETDKKNILNLYRQPDETTSTLADRYGVSNSTISRLLKNTLLESDYEALIQQKRANRTPGGSGTSPAKPKPKLVERIEPKSLSVTPSPQTGIESEDEDSEDEDSKANAFNQRRRRKRSSVSTQSEAEYRAKQGELPLEFSQTVPQPDTEDSEELLEDIDQPEANPLEDLLDEDLIDLDDEDLDDEDLDDDFEEDWDEDEDEEDTTPEPLTTSHLPRGTNIQVLPLSEASFPKPCYLVIDRSAELIARPLREFSDLGGIPAEEIQQPTLPVFDNHRVARRFSNRSQRVIKVPDGKMLQKTCSYLKAKGITRLLIDGQVYSLLTAPLLE